MIKCLTIIQIELEFRNVGFLRRGENRSTRRKTSWSKDENQQQTFGTLPPKNSAYLLVKQQVVGSQENEGIFLILIDGNPAKQNEKFSG